VRLGKHRQSIGTDLVCHIAIGRDTIGTGDDTIDFPIRHE
jgi:hypothetical protein